MSSNKTTRIAELEALIQAAYDRHGIRDAWTSGKSANALAADEAYVERYVKPFRDEIKKLRGK